MFLIIEEQYYYVLSFKVHETYHSCSHRGADIRLPSPLTAGPPRANVLDFVGSPQAVGKSAARRGARVVRRQQGRREESLPHVYGRPRELRWCFVPGRSHKAPMSKGTNVQGHQRPRPPPSRQKPAKSLPTSWPGETRVECLASDKARRWHWRPGFSPAAHGHNTTAAQASWLGLAGSRLVMWAGLRVTTLSSPLTRKSGCLLSCSTGRQRAGGLSKKSARRTTHPTSSRPPSPMGFAAGRKAGVALARPEVRPRAVSLAETASRLNHNS